MDKAAALRIRSFLLQQVKGLELQRSGLLAQIADIEKQYGIVSEKGKRDGEFTENPRGLEDQSKEYLEIRDTGRLLR